MSDVMGTHQGSNDSSRLSAVTTDVTAGIATIVAAGDIDLGTAPQLQAAIGTAAEQSQPILLDVAQVGFMGSVGLSVLVEATRQAGEAGRRLAVVAPQHTVRRAVEITGLDTVLHLFDERDPAVRYLRG